MSYISRSRVPVETRSVLAVLTAALLVVAPFALGGFQTSLLTRTLIFVLFATAFNLLYGYTGLLSFGHAMFIAVGGYTVAKVVGQVAPALGIAETFGGAAPLAVWVLSLVFGMVAATVFAVFVGYLSVRLEEIYFALITLAFSMAVYVVALQDTIGGVLESLGMGEGTFTNGSDGITFLLGETNLFGVEFLLVDILNPLAYYFLTLGVVAVGMYALWRIVKSPFGMTCRAIRENPERARALGINVTRHQWVTFIISGAFSGLAGALLIPIATNVNPDVAYWSSSAEPVIMTVIGGPYAFLGPTVGAFTYEYLRWFISQFPLLEQYWQFSFGVLLLLVVLFFDNGVAGGINRLRAWLADAKGHYDRNGVRGVVAFTRTTIATHAGRVRAAVVGYVRDTIARARAVWRRLIGATGSTD